MILQEPEKRRAELEIEKTAVEDTITVGDHAAFDIMVTSLGPATAQNVTIDDELPNDVLDWEIVSEDIAELVRSQVATCFILCMLREIFFI